VKNLKKAGILLFTIVFLTETMGITVFHHICSGSNSHEVTLYPEFFRHAPACGCSEEEQNTELPAGDQSMDSPSCCLNVTLFCKLPVNTLAAEQSGFVFTPDDHGLVLSNLMPGTDRVVVYETGVHFDSHAPPLSGTRLIHFIHQIKIPSPISLA